MTDATHPNGMQSESLPKGDAAFREEGLAILKNIFPLEMLAGLGRALSMRLASETRDALDDQIMAAERRDHALVYQAAQSVGSSASAYQLLGHSQFVSSLFTLTDLDESELHIMPMYLVIQLPGDRRFDYGWHQDHAYYPWCSRMVTVWFPVNRATTAETGTIGVLPGSHRWPRTSQTHYRHGYFRQIEAEVSEPEVAQEQALHLELGDCCIMDGDLVHRSVSNLSATPRVAAVARMVALSREATYQRERFYCLHKP